MWYIPSFRRKYIKMMLNDKRRDALKAMIGARRNGYVNFFKTKA